MSRASSWLLAALLAATAGSAACARARAETVPDGPPLAMPSPPEHAVAPVEALPQVPAVVPETPAAAAPPPRPAPRPAAEGRPHTAPPPAQPPPAPPPVETRELRPAPLVSAADAERDVRETLTRAARDIGRVDYGRLSAAGRAQYDQSKRFTEQAEQALRERNYVFAATLADKAATLAAELAGR